MANDILNKVLHPKNQIEYSNNSVVSQQLVKNSAGTSHYFLLTKDNS